MAIFTTAIVKVLSFPIRGFRDSGESFLNIPTTSRCTPLDINDYRNCIIGDRIDRLTTDDLCSDYVGGLS